MTQHARVRTSLPPPTPRSSTPTSSSQAGACARTSISASSPSCGPASARLQLKKDESILLLVLRLLYEEKSGEIAIHGERTVRQQEIQDRLKTVADLSYRKTPFLALLRRFQALRLINIRGPEDDPETTVILFPSIPFVLDGVSVEEIAERIQTYRSSDYDDQDEGDQEVSE